MKTRTMALAILLLLPALPATAAALSYQDLRSIRQACGADIKSLCGNIQRGDGRLAECIRTNAAQLSPGCSDVLKAEKAKLPATAAGSSVYDTD